MPPSPQLKLGEPVVVAVSAPNENRWGFTQFPAFSPLPDGRILLVYADAEDASETHGCEAPAYVSADQGQTWSKFTDELVPSRPHYSVTPAYNGEFLTVPAIRYMDVRKENIALPEPVSTANVYGTLYSYRVSDFAPRVHDYFQHLGVRRWRPASGRWEDDTATYEIKDMLAWRRENSDVLPRTFFERPALKHKGELLYADYRVRYRTPDGHFPSKGGTTLMASADNGLSFQRRATVALDLTGRDLYGEPALEETSDGGLVSVIRRADHEQKPMAICYSQDAGHSWSPPQNFCDFGVFPYLAKLDSGALVVSYGRPGVWLRFNMNGDGREWGDPVCILPGDPAALGNHTCGYTSMRVIGPRSFLLAYSDFDHHDDDGTPRKAILSRRVDVLD